MSSVAETLRGRRLVFLPLFIFLGLSGVFLLRLFGEDVTRVPSALIGRPAPEFTLPPLEGTAMPGLSTADLRGQVTLVNVWASWCGPCREEHPQLMALARDARLRVVGINHLDEPANARRFLTQYGNPFAAVGVERTRGASIDWGVFGVPESFLVGRDGRVLYKVIGAITPALLEGQLKPEIEKAIGAAS